MYVGDEQISKAQLRLTDIAECLESDWLPLANQLGISAAAVAQIQHDYLYSVEQVRLASPDTARLPVQRGTGAPS